MTAEVAIKIRQNPTAEDVDNQALQECIDRALERQIPKEPYITYNKYDEDCQIFDWWICQNCESKHKEKYDYCPDCGQAIDWR